MNIFFEAVYDLVSKKDKRTCQYCGKSLHVDAKDKDKSVICKNCGRDIPPVKKRV